MSLLDIVASVNIGGSGGDCGAPAHCAPEPCSPPPCPPVECQPAPPSCGEPCGGGYQPPVDPHCHF